MSGWQPIETAPKDGTEILAFSPPDSGLEGYMQVVEFWANHWRTTWDLDRITVTHWMPLPEIPLTNEVDAK